MDGFFDGAHIFNNKYTEPIEKVQENGSEMNVEDEFSSKPNCQEITNELEAMQGPPVRDFDFYMVQPNFKFSTSAFPNGRSPFLTPKSVSTSALTSPPSQPSPPPQPKKKSLRERNVLLNNLLANEDIAVKKKVSSVNTEKVTDAIVEPKTNNVPSQDCSIPVWSKKERGRNGKALVDLDAVCMKLREEYEEKPTEDPPKVTVKPSNRFIKKNGFSKMCRPTITVKSDTFGPGGLGNFILPSVAPKEPKIQLTDSDFPPLRT